MSLQCGVWGIFPDDSLAPIKTSLNIDILDDICFWKLKDAAKLFIFQHVWVVAGGVLL